MTRTHSKKRKRGKWHQSHTSDKFVREAKRLGLRARSHFKIEEIDRKYKLFNQVHSVLDLGASPGGWANYAAAKLKTNGVLYAIDILPMKPIDGVHFDQLDITNSDDLNRLCETIPKRTIQVVMSDMAPNISGNKVRDVANFELLHDAMFEVTEHALANSGSLVYKIFNDSDSHLHKRRCQQWFGFCEIFKPKSSRSRSQEMYLVAMNYRGGELGFVK